MLSPELTAVLGELTDLHSAGALLGWDQQTMMPPAGAAGRGEVMATLALIGHERQTSPRLLELLDAAVPEGEVEEAIVRVARRDAEKAARVPAELAGDVERAASAAQEPWASARAANDFERFRPFLERNLELRRAYAACFPEAEHPYDALLDNFEPGLTTARVTEVFATLREGLVPLVAAIAAAPPAPTLPGPFPIEEQRAFALEVARSLGFTDEAWRLDLAVHPFAQSLNHDDVRVTARFRDDDLQGLFAVMHEMGHGLYEHQIDPALARTTLGAGVSLGIHESQSRMWENLVGRSEPFWRCWMPRLRERFGAALGELDDAQVLHAINAVRPTFIRVDADEVTYGLHVILRFELEVEMLEGRLAVADLPAAWNAKMQELLGVTPPDDTRGVLQDIHWSFGELGYFPTYAIGNIVAAQLWEAIGRDLPDLDAHVEAGDHAPLRAWLREHVHAHGRVLTPAELLRRATGAELDPAPLLAQLDAKYRRLYGLDRVAVGR